MDKAFMSLSLVPYLLFLYLMWRIHKLDSHVVHRRTFIGFCAMIGFIIVTATTGIIALKVIGARTLAHVDVLHAIAEGSLTITNGLIVYGLKKQLDEINSDEESEATKGKKEEVSPPVYTAVNEK